VFASSRRIASAGTPPSFRRRGELAPYRCLLSCHAMAPATVVGAPLTAFAPDGPTSFWFTRRFTPVGSTRSRSTSRSFSAKLLTPSDFESLADLKRNVIAFQTRYQRAAKPFKWAFTRCDLHVLLTKLKKRRAQASKLRYSNTSP